MVLVHDYVGNDRNEWFDFHGNCFCSEATTFIGFIGKL